MNISPFAKKERSNIFHCDPLNAMTSMMSDLSKHPELKNHAGLEIAPMFYGAHNDPDAVRRWIEGFN